MSDLTLAAANGTSAQITLTDTHVVIAGRNMRIVNGFLYKTEKNCVIERSKVLSIERIKMRSKRMLLAFIICMGIFVLVYNACRSAVDNVSEISGKLKKAEQALSVMTDGDRTYERKADRLEDSLDDAKRKASAVIFVCVLIALGGGVCLAVYALRPYELLRIAASGVTAAVEVRYYNKQDIDNIINLWNRRDR